MLNTYWNYMIRKRDHILCPTSYLFSLKNSRPCRDLNPGPPRYQADMLPIELSWLGCCFFIRSHLPSLKNVVKGWKEMQLEEHNLH